MTGRAVAAEMGTHWAQALQEAAVVTGAAEVDVTSQGEGKKKRRGGQSGGRKKAMSHNAREAERRVGAPTEE